MLSHIHIRNLALIPEIDLDLNPGLTLFTGETGAGKSLFTDALGLVLGDRADSSIIRSGSTKAEVNLCANIQNLPLTQAWLQDNDLDNETGHECFIRRILSSDGRSRAYINGSRVSLQQLRTLGEQLVNIQGQHAHQTILKPSQQRHMLDNYAQHEDLLNEVTHLFQHWHTANEKLAELHNAQAQKEDQLQLLRFKYEELTALALQDNELHTLETEHQKLSRTTELRDTLEHIVTQLEEASENPVNPTLARLANQLDNIKNIDPGLKESACLLNEAHVLLSEVTRACQNALTTLRHDPERLQALDQRLGKLYDTARKYRIQVQDLPELIQITRTQYEQFSHIDSDIAQQTQCVDELWQQYHKKTAQLTQQRTQKAKLLAAELTQRVHALGMETAEFEIQVIPESAKPAAHGQDTVQWRFTANPGTPAQPLSAIASGGELSRICLAIHSAIATDTATPTLIFDEADSGIGGKVAEFVGKLLKELSNKHQVLCITHLPQVACYGNQHIRIHKQSLDGRTETLLHPLLDQTGRIEELARMLGGLDITATTRAHAKEMLQRASG